MKKLLKEWQHRLGLDDWLIVLEENCSLFDFKEMGVQGETDYDEVNKYAVIKILEEKDYGKRVLLFDNERVLVHELLHIKLWAIQDSENQLQDRIVHQYIDDLARALVDAKRGK